MTYILQGFAGESDTLSCGVCMNSQMKKGALISYAAIAFNILAVLLYTPFLIRSLGSSNYAIYSLVYAFLSYFTIDFGIGPSIAKFITDYRYGKDVPYNEIQLITIVIKTFVLLGTCVGIIFVGLYPFLPDIFTGLTAEEIISLKEVYRIAAFYTACTFIASPLDGILTANEYFVTLKGASLITKAGTIALTVFALTTNQGLTSVVLAQTLSGLVGITIKLVYLVRHKAIRFDWRYWNGTLLRDLLTFSLWIAVITFAQRFIIPITPTILGRFCDSQEIASFSVASTLEGYIFMFAAALNGLFLPKVSRMINGGLKEDLDRLLVKVGRIQLLIVGTLVAGFCAFGQEFIFLWAGPRYPKTYYILLLIASPDLVYLTQEIASSALVVQGMVKFRSMIYVLGACLSVALSCAFAPKYGALGSAVAIAISLWGINGIAINVVYQKVVGLDIKGFFKNCHLAILPPLWIYTILWIFLDQWLPTGMWLVLIAKVISFTVGWLVLFWYKIAGNDEKILLTGMGRKIYARIHH